MHFLQRLIGEEAEASVGDDAQDGGSEAPVQGFQPLLAGYPDEDVDNAAVHLLGCDSHAGTDHVQGVGEHGSRGASQGAGNEARERRQCLSLESVVVAQDLLVLLVGAELDGGVGDHPHHGGRVPSPEAPEALVEVGAIDQPVRFLGRKSL